jgi:type IV pilus assembly protein PilB
MLKINEKELVQLYAAFANIPFIELDPKEVPKETMQVLPERIARQYNAVVFKIEGEKKSLAMEDPDDIPAISFLQKQLSKPIRVHIATTSIIQAAIDQYGGDASNVGTEIERVIAIQEKDAGDEVVDKADVAEDSPIAQTVNLIIDYGVKNGASDIHIEPRENFVVVRYRVDGILREVNKLPRKVLGALVSRIKILANLKIDEHRAPQDGRFKIVVNNHVYALRVSTLPIVDGEKVVMRILDESSKPATLEELGYWGYALEAVQQAIVQPHGMVLVTGPTGSGKTTTLYACLKKLRNPQIKVITIEDPIEYHLDGVSQTQVDHDKGYDFGHGLRAAVRQDPDVIMVGEIRDEETASVAIDSALTGHIVFSTLHTNNAAGAIPRLIDIGVNPKIISSALNIAIGQRLVRRLCTTCKEVYTPEGKERIAIDREFPTIEKFRPGTLYPDTLWKAAGCEKCSFTGYKGRISIYEGILMDRAVEEVLRENPSEREIKEASKPQGILDMRQDGILKAIKGITSIDEVERAVGLEEGR